MLNVYVEAFLTKNPKEGIAIVQARHKDALALDIELAEYFKERAQIEENYAKSLAKASKRLYTMDPAVLGHFAPVWELLLQEFNQIASYHSDMAYKITREIEKPLRTPPSAQDDHKLQQLEPAIHALENKKKGGIFRKPSLSKPPSANGNWESQGQEYLTAHHNIDQARLARLKSLVEHFERIQSDQLMKRVELSQTTMSAAEVFDVDHDIRDFCTQRGKGLITTRPHIASQPSHDSLRSNTSSTNKFKSVFMKKKRQQHDKLDVENNAPQQQRQEEHDEPLTPSTFSTQPPPSINQTPEPIAQNNTTPLIDAEGYNIPVATVASQFPNFMSEVSSRNTSDDLDSDYQSMKLNQRLQINIKEDAVKDEQLQENESFNKMATMLRERTPTISRKPRGRRESALIRSQTDSSIYDTFTDTNPFKQSPMFGHSSLIESPSLQPIMEHDLVLRIMEKVQQGEVQGQISVVYRGATTSPIAIHLSQVPSNLVANPQYIDEGYVLKTEVIPQGQPTVCFQYSVPTSQAPAIQLRPSWKCVDGMSYLMIKHNVQNTQIQGTVQVYYDHVTTVQSTPQGIWDVAKKRLTWQTTDLAQDTTSRLLAKFFLQQGHTGTPQPILLHLKNTLMTDIQVTDHRVEKMTTFYY